jgi:hypothetical protein
MGGARTRSASASARLALLVELIVHESSLDVRAGELEVRPPGVPTVPVECTAALDCQ